MRASSSMLILPRRAAGCDEQTRTPGSKSPSTIAPGGAGSASGLVVSHPRPASARRCQITENPASRGLHPEHLHVGGGGRRPQRRCGLHREAIGQAGRHDHAQPRPPETCRPPGPAHLVIDPGQHVPGGARQHGARRGQAQALAPALQQRRADDFFQPPDLLAQGRLGDEHPLRGVREAGERHEIPQMPQSGSRRRCRDLYRQLRRFQLCLIHVTHLPMPLPGGPRRPCARSVPARTCDHDHRSTPAPRGTGKVPKRHPAQPTRREPSTDQAGHRISGSACIPRERPWTQIRAISAGRMESRASDTRLASVVLRWFGRSVGVWDPA